MMNSHYSEDEVLVTINNWKVAGAAFFLFLLIIIFFRTDLYPLHLLWLNTNNGYSHGYLVLFMSAYFMFKKLHCFSLSQNPLFLIAPLAGFTALWTATKLLNIEALLIPLIIPIFWLTLGASLGIQVLRATAAPVFLLFLAVPIWDLLLPILQWLAVFVTQIILEFMGVPALIQGDVVFLPGGEITIAESCSGLRYLTISITLSIVYSMLNLNGDRFRGMILLSLAVCLALAANWTRIISIIYIGYTSDMKSPLIEDHYNFGWLLYGVSLIPFFWIAGRLIPFEKGNIVSAANIDTIKNKPNPAIAATAVLIIMSATLFIKLYNYPVIIGLTVAPPPTNWHIASTQTEQLESRKWHPTYIGAEKTQHIIYKSDTDEEVRLDAYLYFNQAQGKELISDLNHVVNNTRWRTSNHQTIYINKLMIDETELIDVKNKRLVWSWYEVADTSTNNRKLAKLFELKNLLQKKVPSQAVVFSSPCAEDCVNARQSLHRFITKAGTKTENYFTIKIAKKEHNT